MRTTRFLVVTGDYQDRLNEAYQRARANEQIAPTARTGADDGEYLELQAEYEALKIEAETEGIAIKLRSLNRREWRVLQRVFPARVGDEWDTETVQADRVAGLNVDAVADALMYTAMLDPDHPHAAEAEAEATWASWGIDATGLDPQTRVSLTRMTPGPAWEEWADELPRGDFEMVLQRAWLLSNQAVTDPKPLAGLRTRGSGKS